MCNFIPTNNTDNTSQKNTNNNNSNNQQKPQLPQANLTSRVSEIFELINTEKHNNQLLSLRQNIQSNSGTEVVKLWYGNGGRLSILTLSLLLLVAVLIGGFDFDFI